MRYKNWKMYYTMAPGGAAGWFMPLITYHWTLVGNIKRDPFEQTISFSDSKSAMALGRCACRPSYRLSVRLEHAAHRPAAVGEGTLCRYKEFPPLQAPETYNLSGILEQMERNKGDD